MKCVALLIAGLALCTLFAGGLDAQEKTKEVLLKGQITCARCELGLTKNCASVIVVKDNGKDSIYYFDLESNKKWHEEVCSEGRPGEVAGIVSTVDGKQIITVSKLKFNK